MNWLNKVVDEVIKAKPEGEIIVESGISPSGRYHMGYLREILVCDAIMLELKRRGRAAKHVHFVDDQDAFRKVPAGLPEDYQKYLGRPLCDLPAPDDSGQSYADYLLAPFLDSLKALGIEMEVIRSHQKYNQGFFVPAIELVLSQINGVRDVLETVSGRQLDEQYSPIQVNEEGYLKKRPFKGIDTDTKTIHYLDKNGQPRQTGYQAGQVKLDWRLDWPARWWLLKVDVEPFGRDHASKGGSYDTGKALMAKIFKAPPPLPVPYEFINRAGETKKMSASLGTGIEMSEVVKVLPAEVIRFFVLKAPPSKTLYFDPVHVAQLIDEFAELLTKEPKSDEEKQLIALATHGVESTISSVPFTHLVASYQAAGRDADKTLQIIGRTEHAAVLDKQAGTIKKELAFIDQWLEKWAPEDVKFDLQADIAALSLNDQEKAYLAQLAAKIAAAPAEVDGEWFHKAIYEIKESQNLTPQQVFKPLYQALIGKDSGPRAGWFLNDLYIQDKDWLIKRLKLEA
jgi:lysyl-tRNA synthetase class 1